MFGKKKKTVEDFDEKIKEAKYSRIFQALKDIMRQPEIKVLGKDGREEIDFAATCSAMKTKARLAVDFVTDLDEKSEE